ncbi:hypothetical protein HOO65_010204 [Ceratocystis lukuohia]|uniref:BTB domain-containing protein n=1 Tax=Ceratocystis lukuohia TaxID=2019550 RepID=A0ABR4MRD1_9PEZI
MGPPVGSLKLGTRSELGGSYPMHPIASTVSRPLDHRPRRSRRSHANGSSYLPQNEFPVFSQSGDVEIIIGLGSNSSFQNRYLLHSHTLSRFSGFFEASLRPEWNLSASEPSQLTHTGNAGDARSPTIRPPKLMWRYELDRGDTLDEVPMLVQKKATKPAPPSIFGAPPSLASVSNGRTKTNLLPQAAQSTANLFQAVTPFGAVDPDDDDMTDTLSFQDQDLMRDYDNMFRIFYNYTPNIDSISIADAYVQCKSLLHLADLYDALDVVGPRVDHHLLQFQWRLWKQVAKYPISYLRLGYMARSKLIFLEALIHVVGQWPAGERTLRASMPNSVLEIIEDKVSDLEEQVSRVESRLFRLTLYTKTGEPVTPGTSYLDWLAVSFFRQWLVMETTLPFQPPPPHDGRRHHHSHHDNAPPSIPPVQSLSRVYRILGAHRRSSSAYLSRDECKRFLKLTPELYSRENLRRFEKSVNELKTMACDLVQPLMDSDLELSMASGPSSAGAVSDRMIDDISYLTCTQVSNQDIPWSIED